MLSIFNKAKDAGYPTHGGANVPHRKNTAECKTVVMPPPEKVVIPMLMHLGAPCTPLVKAGQTVKVGQKIADSDKFVSAPIHSPISGKVKAIGEMLMPQGMKAATITIESDGEMTLSEEIKPPAVNGKDDFIKAVRESGLVGLGGAGFPTFIKLNPPVGTVIDTLIINGAECEPYITSDYRELIENGEDVVTGVFAIKKLLGAERAVIAIEDNKPLAIENIKKIVNGFEQNDGSVSVMTLASRYPQGGEKVLIQKVTGRVVPKGKLPADVGCVVMNAQSIAFLARYMSTGMPLITKRLTIDGSAVNNPQNVMACIGTPINDVLEFAGGIKDDAKKIIMGGPMMGIALSGGDIPVLKQNDAVLAFSEGDAEMREPSACIRCGRCVDACPFSLMPTRVDHLLKQKDPVELEKAGTMTCMECGCCSFVCPAGRKLVQSMRLAKRIIRNAPKKEAK